MYSTAGSRCVAYDTYDGCGSKVKVFEIGKDRRGAFLPAQMSKGEQE